VTGAPGKRRFRICVRGTCVMMQPTTLATKGKLPAHPAAPLLAVAVIWALELFVFQAVSFRFDYPVPAVKRIGAVGIRLALDLAFCTGWVFLMPRFLTAAAFAAFLLFTQVAGYYQAVFGRVLSLTTMRAQWSEGVAGARFDVGYIAAGALLLLSATLVLKLWLLHRAAGVRRRRTALRAWAFYFALLAVAMGRVDPPRKLRTFVSPGRFGMTYGFLPLWASEAVMLDREHLLREAIAQRARVTDRLSAIEPLPPLEGDVVLLQVESLDWRVLHHRVDGRPVTPFLDRLADEAMVFTVTAFHANGSGDTDFVMLNAVPPSPSVMTYTLGRYPYADTLPQRAARRGYTPVALHGNSGDFFSRRRTFQRMGFAQTLFLEEMRGTFGLTPGLWGIRDDAVLALSRKLLAERSPRERQLHYLITLTSHQPFIYLEADQHTFLPRGDDLLSRYYNSIHFVDRQLESYIGGLPEGTLVFLFGDHCAMVAIGDTPPAAPERVPFLIHSVGRRLAERQVSRDQPIARSGELTILDAASYVHRLFAQEAMRKEK